MPYPFRLSFISGLVAGIFLHSIHFVLPRSSTSSSQSLANSSWWSAGIQTVRQLVRWTVISLLITSRLPLYCALGQLPFLLHERLSVASFTAIVKYISGLRDAGHASYPNLDGRLSPAEKAKRTAWYAHVESHLGDLVVCHSHSPFEGLTHEFPSTTTVMQIRITGQN